MKLNDFLYYTKFGTEILLQEGNTYKELLKRKWWSDDMAFDGFKNMEIDTIEGGSEGIIILTLWPV